MVLELINLLRDQKECHGDTLAGLFELQRTGIWQLGAQTQSLYVCKQKIMYCVV